LWEKVQRHIEYGGLGIHNLELLGCALRILWLWAQKTEWDRPWAGLPISIPRKAQGLFDVAVDAIVGNGEHILFWTDRWLDGHTMAEIAPNLIKTAGKRTAKPRTVAQATQNRRWVGDINGALTIEVLIEYLHIWDLVDGLLLQPDVQDRYTWKLSHDGIATAKLHIGPPFGNHHVRTLGRRIWKTWAHYWNRTLCLVSRTLGKRPKTLGKPFAECHTRQSGDGKKSNDKADFAECPFSDTRQSLCRVPV
jgi:hypothetical protein